MREGESSRRGQYGQLLILGCILFLASAYFYQDPEWNGNSRLDLTRAIVEKGTLAIDEYQAQPGWETGDKAFYNNHYYSDKAIGSSLLALPFYFGFIRLSGLLQITLTSAAIKHVLTTIVMGGAFTAAGLSMFLIAKHLTGSAWKALISSLSLAFGTMLWPYSAVYYGHVLAAAFLAVAFCLLLSMDGEAQTIDSRRLLMVGLLTGLAFITEYTAALIIAVLIVFAVFVLRKQGVAGITRTGGIAFLGAALPLALAMAYNTRVYGSPFSTGYAYEVENRFAAGMSQGILGIGWPSLETMYHISLDPQFGILWQSPILLLAPVGYVIALGVARYRPAALASLGAAVVMLLMNGGYYLWWGGSAFGPRLLIPALPFLIVPLAAISEKLIWLVAGLGTVSGAQMLIPLMGQVQPTLLVYRPHRAMFYVADVPFDGFSLLYDYGIPQIIRQYESGQQAWTLGAALGAPYVVSVPLLLLAEAVLILQFRRSASAKPQQTGPRILREAKPRAEGIPKP